MQDREFRPGESGGTGESGRSSGVGDGTPNLGASGGGASGFGANESSGFGGNPGNPGFTSGGMGASGTAGSANRPEFGRSAEGTSTGTTNRLGGSGGGLADTLQDLQERADDLMDQAADQLDGVAQRIDELADRAPESGLAARAGGLASGAADTLESVARFLRDNDVDTLQSDLGRIVSRHPVQAVLAAIGAGFVVGKILR